LLNFRLQTASLRSEEGKSLYYGKEPVLYTIFDLGNIIALAYMGFINQMHFATFIKWQTYCYNLASVRFQDNACIGFFF
jgi:hypothetical protein